MKTAGPAGVEDLHIEHAALARVAGLNGIRGTVPVPLGLVQLQDRWVLVETALPGIELSLWLEPRLRRRPRLVPALDEILTWLAAFQRASSEARDGDDGDDLLDGLATGLRRRGELTAARARYLDRVRDLLSGADGRLPVTWEHGDLWPGNVLTSPGRTGVVDWREFATDSQWLQDLWFAVLTTAHVGARRRGGWLPADEAFRVSFLADGHYARRAARAVEAHFRRLALLPELAEPFCFMALVERSRRAESREPIGPPGICWTRCVERWMDAGGSPLIGRQPAAADSARPRRRHSVDSPIAPR